ncbi:MAG: hypothetical protein DRO39_01950 [Thermoprotei archaeon]|nr:MAG: hypothetical protein DRO39_01950 [Thermoprotei archaeon]
MARGFVKITVKEPKEPTVCDQYWHPIICVDWLWKHLLNPRTGEKGIWSSEYYRYVKNAPGEYYARYCYEVDLTRCDSVDECFEQFWEEYVERWRQGTGLRGDKLVRWEMAVEPVMREAFRRALLEWLIRIARDVGVL